MNSTPALFISHGSPMMAINPGQTGSMLRALGRVLPRPRAVVVVSAHHMTRAPEVGTADQLSTIHDFGGFPRALYELQYPARGDADVSDLVAGALEQAGIGASANPARGLDHGAWVPLRYLYPEANVPVVPVAIQPQRDARHHFVLGQALAPLREQGILILTSGNLTHNLSEIDPRARDGQAAPYAVAFQAWFHDRIMGGDLDALLDWERASPNAERAHPTDEHLLPLFVALGAAWLDAATPPRAVRLHDVITLGVLAMDAYAFDRDGPMLERLASALAAATPA